MTAVLDDPREVAPRRRSRRRGRAHEAQLAVVPRSPGVQGRPIVHHEPWTKVTIVMEKPHVLYLDVVSLFFRVRHEAAVSRAELIRAFVEFMQESDIDFTQFKSADDITEFLVPYFSAIVEERGRLPLLESDLFASSHAARNRVRREGRLAMNTSRSKERR